MPNVAVIVWSFWLAVSKVAVTCGRLLRVCIVVHFRGFFIAIMESRWEKADLVAR